MPDALAYEVGRVGMSALSLTRDVEALWTTTSEMLEQLQGVLSCITNCLSMTKGKIKVRLQTVLKKKS